MGKIDTILKVAGVGAIVALGIPVALSVKFGNGRLNADELHHEFGISVWTIGIRSPLEFSSLKAELFQRDESGEGGNTLIGSLEHAFATGRKDAEVRVYVEGRNARILCDGGRSEAALPVDLGQREQMTFYKLGEKGIEVAPRTFELFKHSEVTVFVVVTVE